jgi:F-type H+-transporting ATPase subunit delta
LGKAVHTGAVSIVQARLSTDSARSASIDSFIDELEAMAAQVPAGHTSGGEI